MGKIVSGIQQIGIGVSDLETSWAWYRKYFGMDICIFEEKAVAEFMLHYTEGKQRERHAVLTISMQGGGGFEIWQHTGKTPQMPEKPLKIGDTGINICKMKTLNAAKAHEYFKQQNLNVLSPLCKTPDSINHFFLSDPWGNIFQFVEEPYVFVKDNHVNGGTYGAMIGVSNIEKSLEVYQGILNYDTIVYDVSDTFEDFTFLNGGQSKFRRVLLAHSETRQGAFSSLLGPSQIELIQPLDRIPENVYRGRIWGDPGFIHLCFDISGFENLKKECSEKGFPFTVDSTISLDKAFDMGDAAGNFSYISDPDGTPIEFVETRKVPVIKKLGWYIKLYNRDPKKSLPIWLLKALRFQRKK